MFPTGIILVITERIDVLPSVLERDIRLSDKLRILLDMSGFVQIFIVFCKHCQEVVSKQLINCGCTPSIFRKVVQRLRHIRSRAVGAMTSPGFNMSAAGSAVGKKFLIHSYTGSHLIDNSQSLLELFRRDEFIFCSRIGNNMVLVHLLVSVQDLFRLESLRREAS